VNLLLGRPSEPNKINGTGRLLSDFGLQVYDLSVRTMNVRLSYKGECPP
jgi:hypothetical protein